MDIDVLELSDTSARFVLSDVTTAFANALRRIMISEVPKMAIDSINIFENTSLLYDEQIALRLGLIPIRTDLGSYILRSECKCKNGCPSCQLSLTLSVEGPKVVYSSDLVSKDEKSVPVDRKIPIVKLKEGQKLVLEAIARLGTGKEHVKWQPVVACGYKNRPKVTIFEKCNDCGKCVEVCPRGVFEVKGNKAKVKNEIECSLCNLCLEACETKSLKVSTDKRSFVFQFETDGSMSADKVILQAVDLLKDKTKEFKDKLEKR